MTKVKTWSVMIEEEGEDLILPFPSRNARRSGLEARRQFRMGR
jgi:hypothetical protein